ncbi:MAG TPA: endonuclease III [Polyangia bacterium]
MARSKPAPKAKAKALSEASPWPPDGKRVTAILRGLDRLYPEADCELHRDNPFQLLCATILSAQCTDERVNQVTPHLFAQFPTPETMANAPPTVIENLIRSTGFFHNKAKSLIGASTAIVQQHAGQVPRTMAELCKLPGVARKTANVVLGTAFGLTEGIVVDTHVLRLSQRLALTRSTTPEKIEQALMTLIPRARWILFSHQMIWHGRRICAARRPDCEHCPLAPHCPSAFHA